MNRIQFELLGNLSIMHVSRGIPILAKDSTALTIGNFDGVHLGHQAMIIRLNEAASRLNLTSCVMIFEPHPREFFTPDKAPIRLTSLREKLELLAELNILQLQEQLTLFHHQKTLEQELNNRNKEVFALHLK